MDYFSRAKKFRAKKKLGQNFLIDKNTIDEIISNVTPLDSVLEIGPGLGFVTEKLVEVATDVVAVEIDKDAISILNKNLGEKPNFRLIEGDILKTDFCDIYPCGKKIKIIANIPYYITSPILVHLLGEIDDECCKNRKYADEIILMVQLEVAKRLVANENSQNKEYGMLSILAQFYCDVEIIKKVSKRSFYPSPKVDSALVRLKVNETPRIKNSSRLLKKVIRAGFMARRKNIKNSLMGAGMLNVVQTLEKLNLDPNTRAEKLSILDFNRLASALEEFN